MRAEAAVEPARQVATDGNGTYETTQRFFYDGEYLVLTYNTACALTNRYLVGLNVDEILADENGAGTVTWSLGDNLGSIRDLVQYNSGTNTTTVVNHVQYDTFGQIKSQTNSAWQPLFAYTGREWDADAGLYFYRARWYDARVGRFLSEDPIGFAAGDVNLSRYVANSPTMWVDPSGLAASGGDTVVDPTEYQAMMTAMSMQTGWNGLSPSIWDNARAAMQSEWNTAKAMVMNPLASLDGFGHAYASGMVSDSLQGMSAQAIDMLTFNYFDLTGMPPQYGNYQAYYQGQCIGQATMIAEELALSYGAMAAIRAGATGAWALTAR